jgi:benzil reductase ((S)-benzoin forming)
MRTLYVITGVSRGLGRALIDVVSETNSNFNIEIGRGVSAIYARNAFIGADFQDIAALDSALQTLPKLIAQASNDAKFDRAVLINNAGVVEPVGAFDTLEAAALAMLININVTAPLVVSRAFANAKRGLARSRLIVNISSGAAKRAITGWTAYCTSKAALEMATRVMAEESSRNDPSLAVCSLAPGVVDTPMQAQLRTHDEQSFPDIERFRSMKRDGALRDAHAVARDIISIIESNKLANGGNFDIREMQ